MTFSLVLCTVGRCDVLGDFFASLARQNRGDVEVVLVDQNDDDRCASIVAAFADKMPIKHVRSGERGLSRARNLGLKHVSGTIIGFPDDDCVYFDRYLDRVAGLFAADSNLGGVTGYPTAAAVEPAGDWQAGAMTLSKFTILNRCQEFTIFLRRDTIGSTRFNDGLGVGAGTPWGADEGPDFLMRVADNGAKIVFYPRLYVHHPDKVQTITKATLARSASYARGRGALFRIHRFPVRDIACGLVRPLGGTVVYGLRGQFMRARYYWAIVTGQMRGLFMRSTDLEKLKLLPLMTGRDTTVTVASEGEAAGPLKFSLVMCTYGRRDEIGAFIDSLLRQGRRDVELIIIDQNPDDRLDPIFEKYSGKLPLTRLRTDPRGAARARNIGLGHARGEIAGFPDDDCEYLEGYLDKIVSLFDGDANLGGITGYLTADRYHRLGYDWQAGASDVTKLSVPNQSQEFTIFYRRSAAPTARFNQKLGVGCGTPWGADEGPDFVLRVMQGSGRVVFYPGLSVYHPDKNVVLTDAALARANSYACGRGCFFRLHRYPMRVWLRAVVRPSVGSVLYLCLGKPRKAQYYLGVVRGMLRGLFIRRDDLNAVAGAAKPVANVGRSVGKVFVHG